MRKNTKLQISAVGAASLLLCIIAAVCLFFAVSDEYENKLGHFTIDSIFAPCVHFCLIGGVIIGVASLFVFKNLSSPDRALPGSIALSIASAILASVMMYFAVMRVRDVITGDGKDISFMSIAALIFAFISVVYFYMTALSKNDGVVPAYMSLLSFAPVLFCAMEVLCIYFDTSVAVNSPIKNFCQFNYLVYMLALCAETAVTLGRSKVFARYIATLSLAVSIGGPLSVAAALLTASGAECTLFTGTDAFLRLAFFLYFSIRFMLLVRVKATAERKQEKAENEEITE
ncbi:MAG: hypothetical protein E7575_06300 [Ruminococcaceae bacterium]|nr:hypothetical protein [Oscillospiraceae bacterium]